MSIDVNPKVLDIIETINKSNNNDHAVISQVPTNICTKPKAKNAAKTLDEMRGKPKSGRFWKSKKERFSSIIKTKGLRPDFKSKTSLRLELKRTKELSKQYQEQIIQKELVRKERRRENIKRTEENKRRSEIVQVITNTAKLKRMKKKQLRFIEKRDTNKEIKPIK